MADVSLLNWIKVYFRPGRCAYEFCSRDSCPAIMELDHYLGLFGGWFYGRKSIGFVRCNYELKLFCGC